MNSTERRAQTNRSKYGVDNVAQLPVVQAKRAATFEAKRNTIIMYQPIRTNILNGFDLDVYKLDIKVADEWLNTYHPLGAPRGNMLCLGLVKNNTIYSMMTFKRSRNKDYVAELSRMWTLPTYHIMCGYDILSNAAAEFGVYNVVAYVNRSFERVQDYECLGMRYIRDIQRTKWWIKDEVWMTDASRRQKKIPAAQLQNDGWSAVYDCGSSAS